jgi:hypothetical protein
MVKKKITRIQIPVVNDALADLDDVVDDLEEAFAEIKRVTAGLHGCWGNDEAGQKFAVSYVDFWGKSLESATIGIPSIRQVEVNLRQIVDLINKLDAENGIELEFKE